MTLHRPLLLAACVLTLTACSRSGQQPAPTQPGGAGHKTAPTNRVDIPQAVRDNLGITFAKVERRAVERTLRVPGRFELLPDARREYRTMLAGQVEPLVAEQQTVEAGTPLYRLRSPRWRELQGQIADAEAAVRLARAEAGAIGPILQAHREHEAALAESVRVWAERAAALERLRDAGTARAEDLAQAQTALASARAELAKVHEEDAELEAREQRGAAELESAEARLRLLLETAGSLVGADPERLSARAEGFPSAEPLWQTIDALEVRAAAPGVVERLVLSPGAWAEETSLVLTVVQPERLRFRAQGLQSDIGQVRNGQAARIAPPRSAGLDIQDIAAGALVVGVSSDPAQRTVDLLLTPERSPAWARPGMGGFLEIVAEGGTEELAVPLSSVARDGLTPILFRRDPRDANKVIRLEADLGADDGRWVVVKSGIREGDEIVLDGVYQLMLATSGSAPKGGHFHADGTYHEGED